MKKLLVLAAAAASIFTSCTKQYVDDASTGVSAKEIGFETYVSNTTKGSIKDGFVMGDQFFVYAGNTGTNTFDVTNPNFNNWVFDDVAKFPKGGALVSNYGGTPAVWRYDNPISWTNDKVTFFGFSPVPVTGETYGITYEKPANLTTIPNITFEVKGGYDMAKDVKDAEAVASRPLNKQQVDLLVAVAKDQTKAVGSVEMMFKHSLTRLNFAVRSNAAAGSRIRINSIVVKNVATKGTLPLASDDANIGDGNYVGGWVIDGATAKKNFAVNLINSVASLITDNDIHTITDNDEALMMIPQDLAGIELEVRYASSIDGNTWENYETGVPVKVELNQLATHWNPNKQIRYVLSITPGELIGFTAEVENWGDEDDAQYISKEVGKDAQEIVKMTLKAGDKITASDGLAWMTAKEGANAAKDITTAPIVAVDGEYTFEVKANAANTARAGKITISHANGNQTVIAVSQSAGTGTLKVSATAGEVTKFTLAKGDKIEVPQTKAAAAWVLGKGAAIAGEYTASGDEEYAISVEANAGAARAATLTVTLKGVKSVWTIEQAAGAVVPTAVAVAVAADGTLTTDPLVGTISAIVNGGWLKVDGATITDGAVAGAGALTADANSGAQRVATFTLTDGSTVKEYTVTQAAGAVVPTAVDVAVDASGALTTDALVGTISEIVNGGWLKVDGATITDGAVAGAGTLTAETNLTGAQRVATFTLTDGSTVKEYTVTQAAVVPTAVDVAVDITGASFDVTITLAGETISAVVDGGWLNVGGTTIADGATLTGTVTAEANSGAQRVATFTTTTNDGLTVKNYTVTQAGV